MTYDENKVALFDSPKEKINYNTHHAQYGPGTGKVHPDDCEYCKSGLGYTSEKTLLAAKETQYREHSPILHL